MTTISTEDPVAVAAVAAIHTGDLATLRRLLAEHPGLAAVRLGDDNPDGMSRTLLHVVTDWPGHFPNGAATVAALVEAGADVNARFRGPHEETPLHCAASRATSPRLSYPRRTRSIARSGQPATAASKTPLSISLAAGPR